MHVSFKTTEGSIQEGKTEDVTVTIASEDGSHKHLIEVIVSHAEPKPEVLVLVDQNECVWSMIGAR